MFQPQIYNCSSHGFIYLDDGSLYGVGLNQNGQLGIENISKDLDLKYEFVMHRPDIVKIVCGGEKSFLLLKDGICMSAENGNWVEKAKDVMDICWDGLRLYILKEDGSVWAVLSQIEKFLLTGDESHLTKIDFSFTTPSLIGEQKPVQITGLKNIKKIYAGYDYAVFQDYENKLYIFGMNIGNSLRAFVKNTNQTEIRNKIKETVNIGHPLITTLRQYFDYFVDNYVFPVYFGTKENIHGLFTIEKIIFMWTGNKIEIISGVDDVSFNNPRIIYESNDILHVMANNKYIVVVLDNHEVWKITPTKNIDFKSLLSNRDVSWDFPLTRMSNDKDIVGIFLGENYCLLNHEYVFEDMLMQQVDVLYEFKNMRTPMLILNTDELKRSEKLQTIFPQVYDEVRVKIFGAGTIIPTFDPKYYKFMPYVNRRKILYSLWIFKMLTVKIPKYIRYEILKYIF